MSGSGTIRVNGSELALPAAGSTLGDLLASLGVASSERGLAIAINDAVVPRTRWAVARLTPGDAVEIIRPLRGG